MTHWKKINLFFIGVLVVSPLFSIAPAAQGFSSMEHVTKRQYNILMQVVHKDHWLIGYAYGDDCAPEEQANAAELQKTITTALQLWLQPLHDMNTAQPIVNDFRYQLNADWRKVDLNVIMHCVKGLSIARLFRGQELATPEIEIFVERTLSGAFKIALMHELGHAFGLADTYVGRPIQPNVSTGGLRTTVGTQPASLMSHPNHQDDPLGGIGKDDENGIIWLYKHIHEDLPLEDCFFSNYELEKSPDGCRPKYPIIFEIKQAGAKYALQILREDRTLDINAVDGDGLTALHHAVMNGYAHIVSELLARDGIDTDIKDKNGKTPLQVARELGFDALVQLLSPEPEEEPEKEPEQEEVVDIRSVSAKNNLTTMWGALKKNR